MTEYTDKVQDQDLKNRAEKWGKEVKFIHMVLKCFVNDYEVMVNDF